VIETAELQQGGGALLVLRKVCHNTLIGGLGLVEIRLHLMADTDAEQGVGHQRAIGEQLLDFLVFLDGPRIHLGLIITQTDGVPSVVWGEADAGPLLGIAIEKDLVLLGGPQVLLLPKIDLGDLILHLGLEFWFAAIIQGAPVNLNAGLQTFRIKGRLGHLEKSQLDQIGKRQKVLCDESIGRDGLLGFFQVNETLADLKLGLGRKLDQVLLLTSLEHALLGLGSLAKTAQQGLAPLLLGELLGGIYVDDQLILFSGLFVFLVLVIGLGDLVLCPGGIFPLGELLDLLPEDLDGLRVFLQLKVRPAHVVQGPLDRLVV